MRLLNWRMDHLFGGTHGPVSREYPRLEAWTGDDGLVVVAELPGIDRDEFEITVDGRTLMISGSRPSVDMPEGARAYRQERVEGDFSRSVALPYDVDVEAVNASYANGLLQIELPRVPEEKPRKITVNGA
jgi:HSP20 family protein